MRPEEGDDEAEQAGSGDLPYAHPGDASYGDRSDAAGDGAGPGDAVGVWPEVTTLRAAARRDAARQAEKLRLVVALVDRTEREARRVLARGPRVSGRPADDLMLAAEVTLEVQGALGLSRHEAGALADLAVRLVRVLPSALRALAEGRLDVGRARALADLTRLLDDPTARRATGDLLARAGEAPWGDVSPRAWRARIARAVVKADADAVRRRREQSLAERAVRSWPNGDGTSDLWARGTDEQIALAEQVLTDLAHAAAAAAAAAGGADNPDRPRPTIDQLRADALFDLFRRVRDGADLPGLPVRRERELGLVLHADTFFGDGPAADDPGQRRGNATPVPVDPDTARQEAHDQLRRGVALRVLLTDTHGILIRLLRFPHPPPGGWTRHNLTDAVVTLLPDLPPLRTDSYPATTAITEHVHSRNPTCSSYDCPRPAGRCDLDHDQPWPRGPTDAANLAPRCRRDHELKTRGLVHTKLHPDGAVTTTLLSGAVITTGPEPLPGHGPTEAYEPPAEAGAAA